MNPKLQLNLTLSLLLSASQKAVAHGLVRRIGRGRGSSSICSSRAIATLSDASSFASPSSRSAYTSMSTSTTLSTASFYSPRACSTFANATHQSSLATVPAATIGSKSKSWYCKNQRAMFTSSRVVASSNSPNNQSSPSPPDYPIEPINFNNDFAIVRPNNTMILEELNVHPNDRNVVFDEAKHSYKVGGKTMRHSVTQVVDTFFPKFDADKIINKMINGNNWPRPGYINPFTKQPMKPDEIKRKWKKTSDYAKNMGSWMHFNIERIFNNLSPSPKLQEVDQLFQFKSDVMDPIGLAPFRTEWVIYAEDLNIAGCVDFIGKKDDGTYVIIDWKRAKGTEFQMTNDWQSAFAPINHIADCNGMKYSIQVNIYKYILENYYNITISGMYLVSLHSGNQSYYYTEVAEMEQEVVSIIAAVNDPNNSTSGGASSTPTPSSSPSSKSGSTNSSGSSESDNWMTGN